MMGEVWRWLVMGVGRCVCSRNDYALTLTRDRLLSRLIWWWVSPRVRGFTFWATGVSACSTFLPLILPFSLSCCPPAVGDWSVVCSPTSMTVYLALMLEYIHQKEEAQRL